MTYKPPILVLFALIVGLGSGSVVSQELDHKIPPGYEPQLDRDEQGLWMEIEEAERKVNKSALLADNIQLNDYIKGIVCNVAGEYCNDFRTYLIRNPGFNASMTATGMMHVWTGLIVRATSSDEIAAVVAHEIAHYTQLHSLERFRALKSKMSKGSFFDLGVLLATGYNVPIGQMTAMQSYMSFSREQEQEADLLGVILLANANYDPHAAYRVWNKVIAEEKAAAAKKEKPGPFAHTHPQSEQRAAYLQTWVETQYGYAYSSGVSDPEFLEVLNQNYLYLMEDQLDTNRFGRTKEMLERHAEIGIEPSLVRFFYGEMFRQRRQEGDQELAIAAYRHSIEGGSPPPEAFKNLGYLYLKTDDLAAAQKMFREYLQLSPQASDRAMIEFYLEG